MSREILFYSDFPFGYHNPEAEERMARFAARGYRVHYVEQLGMRNPRLHHLPRLLATLAGRRGTSAGDSPAFDVVSPKLLAPRGLPPIRALNSRWLSRQLATRLEDPRRTIAWIRYPTRELVRFLSEAAPRLVVYELVDDHPQAPGMTERMRRTFFTAERRILALSRLVFASSEPIRERLARLHPNVVLAPAAAVDLERFDAGAAPASPQRRTAVCVGGLDFRLDAELLCAVAEALPDWRFLLAGRIHATFDHRLEQPPNVDLVGPLRAEEIPRFLAEASVCLLPYALGAYGNALFPIKLVEYLAAGRPVVGTPIWAAEQLSDAVIVAAGPREFAAAIQRAAAEDSAERREARRRRVASFSWEARVDQMERAIEEALPGG